MIRFLPALLTLLAVCGSCATVNSPATATITMIGTNDVHGQLLPRGNRGGLVSMSAYVRALREVRAADGGYVLLIDAGDMWQGTLESNLTEGKSVVAAFNAMGYDAVAIGNHEFDFGPVGKRTIPRGPGDDPRGALRARASEAEFPLLTANLAHRQSGQLVRWENVKPSVLLNAGNTRIGVIGVMTARALAATIAANVQDLVVLPLGPAIVGEATKLRAAGADLIIVTAHAGGHCDNFDDPHDISSCIDDSEIFNVARTLPEGVVDHIFAGHVHEGVAHIVNGISITSAWSSTRAFSRVDFVVDRDSGEVLERRVSPPHLGLVDKHYEGIALTPVPAVATVADAARQNAHEQKNRELGVMLAAPFTRQGNPESTLGNLFTDALLDELDADIALHNVQGGLRADLPAGPLTYGSVYEISPFDNHAVILELRGAELRRVIASQALRGVGRVGFSGMRVRASCTDDVIQVTMIMAGEPIRDDDTVRIIVNDYLALGGDDILTPILPEDGFSIDTSLPLTRDAFIAWIERTGGTLHPDDYVTSDAPRWTGSFPLPENCAPPT